jgi:hypothetical protein
MLYMYKYTVSVGESGRSFRTILSTPAPSSGNDSINNSTRTTLYCSFERGCMRYQRPQEGMRATGMLDHAMCTRGDVNKAFRMSRASTQKAAVKNDSLKSLYVAAYGPGCCITAKAGRHCSSDLAVVFSRARSSIVLIQTKSKGIKKAGGAYSRCPVENLRREAWMNESALP